MVLGADQPCAPRTEKRRTSPFGSADSIQLRKTRPSAATVRFGCPLSGGAGDLSSLTEGAGAAAIMIAVTKIEAIDFSMVTEYSHKKPQKSQKSIHLCVLCFFLPIDTPRNFEDKDDRYVRRSRHHPVDAKQRLRHRHPGIPLDVSDRRDDSRARAGHFRRAARLV